MTGQRVKTKSNKTGTSLHVIVSYILQITRLFMNNLNAEPPGYWLGWDWQSSEDKTQKPLRDEDPFVTALLVVQPRILLFEPIARGKPLFALVFHVIPPLSQVCRGFEFTNKCARRCCIIRISIVVILVISAIFYPNSSMMKLVGILYYVFKYEAMYIFELCRNKVYFL